MRRFLIRSGPPKGFVEQLPVDKSHAEAVVLDVAPMFCYGWLFAEEDTAVLVVLGAEKLLCPNSGFTVVFMHAPQIRRRAGRRCPYKAFDCVRSS